MAGISTEKIKERAVLVGVIGNEETVEQVQDYLDELAFLTDTAGAIPVEQFTQKIVMVITGIESYMSIW